MERRLIIAIALSLLVLLTWSGFVSRIQHVDNKEVTQITTSDKLVLPPPASSLPAKAQSAAASLLKFPLEKSEVVFDEAQGAIKEVSFKDYQNYVFSLDDGFLLADPGLVFKKYKIGPQEVTFIHKDQQKQIVKRFIFSNSNYDMWLEIEIHNLSNAGLNITNLPLVLGNLNFGGDQIETRLKDVAIATAGKTLYLNGRKDTVLSEINFIGLRDRYFCAIIEPVSARASGRIEKINSQESQISIGLKEIHLLPSGIYQQKFHIYLGPQELQIINKINPNWSAVVYYGAFNLISHILLQILYVIYNLLHNWGIAVILLSVLISFVFYPLTLKQTRSMKNMQSVQPRVEELRKIYKDNPRKLNEEIMSLYRQQKINPLGGCLPLILQIPVFFALYQALNRSVFLKGAGFLWIKDLSHPDRLFILPRTLPVIGNEINILPLLMMVGMFIQQKISTVATTNEAAEQQKMMLIIFPLMFGIIFYHMPAGLVLYWFTNSTFMLLQQLKTRTSH